MKLSVIVPCYRSEVTLPTLVDRLDESLNSLVHSGDISDFEVLLVVDGSPDDTGKVALQLELTHSWLNAMVLTRNFGQHNALLAGIRAARNDTIVTLDDDLQHPPEEIRHLIGALKDPGVDLAYAIPLVEEHGFARSFASRMVKNALSLAGVANAKSVGAFRAFRSELRGGFAEVSDFQVNLDVLLSWTTSRVAAVPVSMSRREAGRSSYSMRRLITHTVNMVTGYGIVPLRIATWLGFLCAALGIGLLVYVVTRYLLGETTVQGFTTLAALVSMFAGAQMLTIGIIGEYLGRQHFRSMNRPMYLIRRRADASDEESGGPET